MRVLDLQQGLELTRQLYAECSSDTFLNVVNRKWRSAASPSTTRMRFARGYCVNDADVGVLKSPEMGEQRVESVVELAIKQNSEGPGLLKMRKMVKK